MRLHGNLRPFKWLATADFHRQSLRDFRLVVVYCLLQVIYLYIHGMDVDNVGIEATAEIWWARFLTTLRYRSVNLESRATAPNVGQNVALVMSFLYDVPEVVDDLLV